MSLFEKIMILGSLSGMGVASFYFIWTSSSSASSKSSMETLEIRKKILANKHVKILFSTMSFFYLQGFKPKEMLSLSTLYDILTIAKPNYIALQLSEKEYLEKYVPTMKHPLFPEIMDKIDLLLRIRSEEILKFDEIDENSMHNFYCIDFCKKRKCKILFCGRESEENQRIYEAKLELQKLANPNILSDIPDAQKPLSEQEIHKEVFFEETENLYVETIMKELVPKLKIFPDTPYKTIVGLANQENIEGIAQKWKDKFRNTYGHVILEDDSRQSPENSK